MAQKRRKPAAGVRSGRNPNSSGANGAQPAGSAANDASLADLIGRTVLIPSNHFGVEVPGMFYRAKVVGKERSRRGAVVVRFFEDDGSQCWLPAADVRRWLEDQGNRNGRCTNEESDLYAAQSLMLLRRASSSSRGSRHAEKGAGARLKPKGDRDADEVQIVARKRKAERIERVDVPSAPEQQPGAGSPVVELAATGLECRTMKKAVTQQDCSLARSKDKVVVQSVTPQRDAARGDVQLTTPLETLPGQNKQNCSVVPGIPVIHEKADPATGVPMVSFKGKEVVVMNNLQFVPYNKFQPIQLQTIAQQEDATAKNAFEATCTPVLHNGDHGTAVQILPNEFVGDLVVHNGILCWPQATQQKPEVIYIEVEPPEKEQPQSVLSVARADFGLKPQDCTNSGTTWNRLAQVVDGVTGQILYSRQ